MELCGRLLFCVLVVSPVGAWILLHQTDNIFGVPHLSISEDKHLWESLHITIITHHSTKNPPTPTDICLLSLLWIGPISIYSCCLPFCFCFFLCRSHDDICDTQEKQKAKFSPCIWFKLQEVTSAYTQGCSKLKTGQPKCPLAKLSITSCVTKMTEISDYYHYLYYKTVCSELWLTIRDWMERRHLVAKWFGAY